VPQTLRSRAITWGMQRGMDLWQASSYFGVSTQVLHEVYGHHHPDHLRSAADVMSRPRRPRVRQMRVCNQRLEVAFEHNLVGNPVGGPAETKPRRPRRRGLNGRSRVIRTLTPAPEAPLCCTSPRFPGVSADAKAG